MLGVWIRWNGTVEWTGMEWTGMEWNGMDWTGLECLNHCACADAVASETRALKLCVCSRGESV